MKNKEIEISQEDLQEKLRNSTHECNGDCGGNCTCEKSKDVDNETYPEDENDNVDEEQEEFYTEDEVVRMIKEVTPNIQLNTDHLNGLALNNIEFIKGVNEFSKYAGQYIALSNVGISEENAIQLIINMQTIKHNEILNTQTCNNNLQIAKVQATKIEESQI